MVPSLISSRPSPSMRSRSNALTSVSPSVSTKLPFPRGKTGALPAGRTASLLSASPGSSSPRSMMRPPPSLPASLRASRFSSRTSRPWIAE